MNKQQCGTMPIGIGIRVITAELKLTPKGKRAFRKMAEQHEQWVISMLGHLEPDEVEQLMGLLQRVKQGL